MASAMASRILNLAVTRLDQRALDDLAAETGGLGIHLDRGDTLARAGDLEVHVAVEVFPTDDVGQKDILVLGSHETDRDMPATGALILTPASIRASVHPQVLAIEVEPLDSRTSEVSMIV